MQRVFLSNILLSGIRQKTFFVKLTFNFNILTISYQGYFTDKVYEYPSIHFKANITERKYITEINTLYMLCTQM